jgi:predicted metal-dependent phosphoesterase TrpH
MGLNDGDWMTKIRFDPHIHSYVSDGEVSPEEIVRYAGLHGLEAISVTDHNTFLGSYIAQKEARATKNKTIVVPGAEFRTEYGDILVLCSNVPVMFVGRLKKDCRKHVSFLQLVELAYVENCVLVAAHPFALIRKGSGRAFELRYLDCVEVFNSSSDIFTNIYSIYATRGKKCRIAGSDAHIPELIGSSHTLVEVSDLSREEIIESLRKTRAKPYYDISAWTFRTATLMKKRLEHSLRMALGDYGDPWKRTQRLPL